jgi:hypothetical protein
MDMQEAEARGWNFVHHKISAKKGNVSFMGVPEEVFARIERHEEHGDEDRARAEAHIIRTHQGDLDILLRRFVAQLGEHEKHWADYEQHSNRREHVLGLRSLEKATESLGKATALFRQVPGFPPVVLRENKVFQVIAQLG